MVKILRGYKPYDNKKWYKFSKGNVNHMAIITILQGEYNSYNCPNDANSLKKNTNHMTIIYRECQVDKSDINSLKGNASHTTKQ